MSMDNYLKKTRDTIATYFNASWAETSVQYPNTILTTDGLTEFITLTLQSVTGFQQTITNQRQRGQVRHWLLIIQIFTKGKLGDGRAYQIADLLEDFLTNKTLDVSGETNQIIFEVPNPPTSISSQRDGWFQMNVSYPYYVRN